MKKFFLPPLLFLLYSCTGSPADAHDDELIADLDAFEEAEELFTEEEEPPVDEDIVGPRIVWTAASGMMNELPARYRPVQILFDDDLWVMGGFRDLQTLFCWYDVWKSRDGFVWHSMPGDPVLLDEKTRGAAGTLHNGRPFVVSNTIADRENPTAAVVSLSDDGRWKKISGAPPFGPRMFPTVFSFKGKLWVIGGYDTAQTPLHDIYSSVAGVMWERHTETFPYPPDGTPVIFNGRAWVIGGSEEGIAYSEDGENWQLQPVTAPFTGRTELGVTTHNEQLYVTGGKDSHGTQGGLWRSTDGIVWEEIVTAGLPERSGAVFASLRGMLIITAGFDRVKGLTATTFYSADNGFTWQELAAQEGFTGRYRHSFLRTDRGFYIIGGSMAQQNDITVENTVYFSETGYSWTRIALPQPLLNKSGMAFAFFHDRLWGIGGNPVDNDSPSTGTVNEIVASNNGMAWEMAAADPALTPRSHAATTVFKERLWVVGGFDYDGEGMNDVWASDDGLAWDCILPAAPFTGRGRHGLHVLNDALYLIGGERYWYDDGVSDIWRSTDGIVWEELTHFAFPARAGLASAAGNGALWVFGGGREWEGVQKDLWLSFDGADWRQESYAPALPARRDASMLFEAGRLWLAGGLNEEGPALTNLSDVWYADLPADLLP